MTVAAAVWSLVHY